MQNLGPDPRPTGSECVFYQDTLVVTHMPIKGRKPQPYEATLTKSKDVEH